LLVDFPKEVYENGSLRGCREFGWFTSRRTIYGVSVGTSIQFFSFADRKITTVAAIEKGVFLGLAIAPDGRSLLYTQKDQEGFDLMLVENFR